MAKQTIEQAEAIAVNCARALAIAGQRYVSVPYSEAQLCEVIATLLGHVTVLKDAETVANRRFAASNARYAKLAKKTGQNVAEENEAI
jgi:hypothetical protein